MVHTAQVLGDDVVEGKSDSRFSAILTGIVIPPEDLAPG